MKHSRSSVRLPLAAVTLLLATGCAPGGGGGDEPEAAAKAEAAEALRLAQSMQQNGEIEQALVEFGKAIALDPDARAAHLALGKLYHEREIHHAAEIELSSSPAASFASLRASRVRCPSPKKFRV